VGSQFAPLGLGACCGGGGQRRGAAAGACGSVGGTFSCSFRLKPVKPSHPPQNRYFRYYDKFVRGLGDRAAAQGWSSPLLVALAFSEQLRGADGIPMGAHDRRVDAVATPEGLLLCSAAARQAEGGA